MIPKLVGVCDLMYDVAVCTLSMYCDIGITGMDARRESC